MDALRGDPLRKKGGDPYKGQNRKGTLVEGSSSLGFGTSCGKQRALKGVVCPRSTIFKNDLG